MEKGFVVKVEREVGQRVRAEVDAAARLKEGDNDKDDEHVEIGGRILEDDLTLIPYVL